MTKRLVALLLAVASAPALAAGGVKLEASHANVHDRASLQRGARLFVNYCLSCHEASFMRYARVGQDLGLSEEQVAEHLIFTGKGVGETMTVAMDRDDAIAWFGAPAPDLSLTARAKPGGADWIYTYLRSFYVDESRPLGWNNTVLPNASMPHVLWELQGIQRPVYAEGHQGDAAHVERLELVQPGTMSPAEYDQAMRDLAAFMAYVAEPAALKRESMGVWVLLFLALFTFLAWLLKHEYWRDVH
ncbi:MAG TPA: cytochrome c1 [Xanthomonadaceae bacterium]|nr:cytochrome c1 [Xanthomonadaceae bacterium]